MPYGKVEKTSSKYAVVQMERQDMCGECHVCEQLTGKKSCKLKCLKKIACEVGDTVEVEIGQAAFLKATYMMYGLPLLGLLGGLGIGYYCFKLNGGVGQEDVYVLIGSTIGVMVALIGIGIAERKGKFARYLPLVVGKMGRDNQRES